MIFLKEGHDEYEDRTMSLDSLAKVLAMKGLDHLEFRILIHLSNAAGGDGVNPDFAKPINSLASQCSVPLEVIERAIYALKRRPDMSFDHPFPMTRHGVPQVVVTGSFDPPDKYMARRVDRGI
jgi:hypothetical protein